MADHNEGAYTAADDVDHPAHEETFIKTAKYATPVGIARHDDSVSPSGALPYSQRQDQTGE